MGFLTSAKRWLSYLSASLVRTAGYEPPPRFGATWQLKAPPFSLAIAETMLLDHQVAFGIVLGNSPLLSAKVKVTGPSDVAEFVAAQWDRIWSNHSRQLFRAKYFGYAGYEVMYRRSETGQLEFDKLLDRSPRDTAPLTYHGRLVGVRFRGLRNAWPGQESPAQVDLYGAKALWLTYDAEYGQRFGRALLEHAYLPYFEKVMDGGAIDLRRLRMVKDAWIGDVIKYPMGRSVTLPDGSIVPWRDVVREMGELRASGGMLALPSDCDENGKPLVEYIPPTSVSGATQIMDWIHDLDWDILDGLYVPKEIVEASETGSGYSGRSIPFVSFLSVRDAELADDVRQVNEQILQPLVALNYGRKATKAYEIKPVPLLDTVGEQMAKMGQPDTNQGRPGGQQPGQLGMRPDAGQAMQFSVDDQGHEHKGTGPGGGQFTAKGKGDGRSAGKSGKELAAKEPWAMTKAEFFAEHGSDSPDVRRLYATAIKAALRAKKPLPEEVLKENPEIADASGRAYQAWELTSDQHDAFSLFSKKYRDAHADHKREVRKAFAEGKPVPLNVLAEYASRPRKAAAVI